MMQLRRFAPLVVLSGMLLVAGCDAIKGAKQEATGEAGVRRRIKMIFDALQSEGVNTSGPIQTAICQWWKGVNLINDEWDLGRASNEFTAWATRKQIQSRFGTYRIASVTKSGDNWLATVEVDGRPLNMSIPKDAPIAWVD